MKTGFLMKLSALSLLAAGVLAACTAPQVSSTATQPGASPTAASTVLPTHTLPAPSPTPAANRVVLAAAGDYPQPDLLQARELLTRLADQAGMVLDVRPDLQPADLRADSRVVVLLTQPDNLEALLRQAPSAQFVLVASGALQSKANLSVISADPLHLAFAAGYIATIISPDWRSAGLLPDQPEGLLQAFQNGGRYWCGRCIPNFAPVVLFPVASALPMGSTPQAWQQAFESLRQNVLQTLYLPAQVSSPELLQALAAQNINLLGGQAPAEALKARWVVTLRQDPLSAIETLWPDLLAGKGGAQLAAPIVFDDINESLFTPGRQLLVQDVIAGLIDGSIAPLSVAP